MRFYTVAEAAKRVKRDVRTIERWITGGLKVITFDGRRYIEESHLLAVYREKLTSPRESRPERVVDGLVRKYGDQGVQRG